MSAPKVGDSVLYEGAAWHVVAEGTASLQRFGDAFRPVGELYVVLRADADPSGEAPEVKVPKSQWDRIEIVAPG
jgi:hypothetical protein